MELITTILIATCAVLGCSWVLYKVANFISELAEGLMKVAGIGILLALIISIMSIS